jgi:DNA-binding protein H-NS
MKTVKEYLEHAEECDELARTARSAEERKQIAGMAATWRMLAKNRELKIKKETGRPK